MCERENWAKTRIMAWRGDHINTLSRKELGSVSFPSRQVNRIIFQSLGERRHSHSSLKGKWPNAVAEGHKEQCLGETKAENQGSKAQVSGIVGCSLGDSGFLRN